MKITLQDPAPTNAIQSYRAGQVVINQQAYDRSIVLTPDRLMPDWQPQTVQELRACDFEAMLALEPSLIILGTGKRQIFPPLELYASILEKGIGLEIMDTAAACRTFNILMSEGRRVVAALMMI